MTHEQKAREIVDASERWFDYGDDRVNPDALTQIITAALREAAAARDEIWQHRLVSAVKEARRQALEEAARVAENRGDALASESLSDLWDAGTMETTGSDIAARIRALAQEGEV